MRALRVACGVTFLAAGLNHFRVPRVYRSIMPDYLPAHHELVLASGVAEAVGGAGLLLPRTQRAAGWWLLATLAAVFPANVHMALHHDRYPQIPRWALVARLPFQLVFGAWVAAAMRAD